MENLEREREKDIVATRSRIELQIYCGPDTEHVISDIMNHDIIIHLSLASCTKYRHFHPHNCNDNWKVSHIRFAACDRRVT
jgi:hypothetical protein